MNPGTPFSLLLIAGGAILVWGVEDRVDAIDLAAVGVILLGVGAVGLALSLAFWSALFSRPRGDVHTHGETYVEPSTTTYVTRERVVEPRDVRTDYDPNATVDYREETRSYRR